MPFKKVPTRVIPLLRGSVDTLFNNPIILFPFLTTGFIQLLILEMLYFSPRFPLAGFFNPIVKTLWGEKFIHYPHNIVILPKLFQYFQVPIYIFISSFLIAAAVMIISDLNNGKKGDFLSACREALKHYIHIFVGAFISFSHNSQPQSAAFIYILRCIKWFKYLFRVIDRNTLSGIANDDG